MTQTVWKFSLQPGLTRVDLPRGASALRVAAQGDHMWMWVRLNPAEDLEPRAFRVYGTGHLIEDDASVYVGTADMGSFVWHVFEVVP